MIEKNETDILSCRSITINYHQKESSETQWQTFAESWELSVPQMKYLVEKCAVATLFDPPDYSFLPELLQNLKDGNVIN